MGRRRRFRRPWKPRRLLLRRPSRLRSHAGRPGHADPQGGTTPPSCRGRGCRGRQLGHPVGRGLQVDRCPDEQAGGHGLPLRPGVDDHRRRDRQQLLPAAQPPARLDHREPDGLRYLAGWRPVLVDRPRPVLLRQANTAFVPDNPAQNSGVSVFQTISAGRNVFGQRPQWSWIYQDGLNDPNVAGYKSAGLDANNPVAMGRCAGRPGWCVNGIVAFQNGLIGSARGSNTALNASTTQLESGMVRHLHRRDQQRRIRARDGVGHGQRARPHRGGGARGHVQQLRPGAARQEVYWGEWRAAYPGLPNLGNIGFMKVVGYVDLPDMKAPTAISVTTGWNPWINLNAGRARPHAERGSQPRDLHQRREQGQVPAQGRRRRGGVQVGAEGDLRRPEAPLAYYLKVYFGTRARLRPHRLGRTGRQPVAVSCPARARADAHDHQDGQPGARCPPR